MPLLRSRYGSERLTFGDLDPDNSDFEGAGADGTDISVGTDWVKSFTSAEIDDESGSGVTTYNGSTFCVKIHTATGDFPRITIEGVNFDNAFVIGAWYEISVDYKTLNCTYAHISISNTDNETLEWIALDSLIWTTLRQTFQVVGNNDLKLGLYSHRGTDEIGNEILWVDNISIRLIYPQRRGS